MNIEKHISNLKQYIKDDKMIEKDGSDFANFCKGHIDDIQAVLNELEKKDKVIDLMANKLVEAHGWFYSEFDNYTKEAFKQYFYKKASEEKC